MFLYKNFFNKTHFKMKNLLLLFSVLFLFSCQENNYQDSQLIGEWTAAEWNDLTNEKTINIPVTFTFDAENRYDASYGNSSEKGKYWISASHLHTVEDGKAEKKVEIKKLENDSLIFGMNRMGNLEEIVLVKSK